MRQRQHPRRIDKRPHAKALEINHAAPLNIVGSAQVAQPVERRLDCQRVVGELFEKAFVGCRVGEDVGTQCLGQGGVTPQRTQVKENVGLQQALRIAAFDPAFKLAAPFVNREGKRRISCHDVATT